MRLLQWLKREKEVVLVPVFGDNALYADKWKNEGYLKSVESMSLNGVWITEIIDCVTQIRNKADESPTVEALRAYNDCIKIVKDLLVKPEMAKITRKYLDDERTNAADMSSLK